MQYLNKNNDFETRLKYSESAIGIIRLLMIPKKENDFDIFSNFFDTTKKIN
jgi:hypothetical protein